MSEHQHDWALRGDKADPWVKCSTCGEVRNGWANATQTAPHLSTDRTRPLCDDHVESSREAS